MKKLIVIMTIFCFLIVGAFVMSACDKVDPDPCYNCDGCEYCDTDVQREWGAWVVTTAPGCTTAGERTRTCQNDSRFIQREPIDPLGHNFQEWQAMDSLYANRVLILQSFAGQSNHIENALSDHFDLTVLRLTDAPDTVNALKQWDMIILLGINYNSMSTEMAEALYEFVYVYGGGLLTSGAGIIDGDDPLSQMKPFYATESSVTFGMFDLSVAVDGHDELLFIDNFYSAAKKTGAYLHGHIEGHSDGYPIGFVDWGYGEGRVGSFLSRFYSSWGSHFFTNLTTGNDAIAFLIERVNALMPLYNMRGATEQRVCNNCGIREER